MGYMTVVSFLNDAADVIEKNPDEFVKGMMNGGPYGNSRRQYGPRAWGTSFGVGNHCNPATVHQSQHADVPQLTLAHQNSLIMIGWRGAEGMTERDLDLYERCLKTARREIKLASESIKERREQLAEQKANA